MASVFRKILVVVFIFHWVTPVPGHPDDIEFKKVIKHEKKHWKRLQKKDGAIRLVGGRSELEG